MKAWVQSFRSPFWSGLVGGVIVAGLLALWNVPGELGMYEFRVIGSLAMVFGLFQVAFWFAEGLVDHGH